MQHRRNVCPRVKRAVCTVLHRTPSAGQRRSSPGPLCAQRSSRTTLSSHWIWRADINTKIKSAAPMLKQCRTEQNRPHITGCSSHHQGSQNTPVDRLPVISTAPSHLTDKELGLKAVRTHPRAALLYKWYGCLALTSWTLLITICYL